MQLRMKIFRIVTEAEVTSRQSTDPSDVAGIFQIGGCGRPSG